MNEKILENQEVIKTLILWKESGGGYAPEVSEDGRIHWKKKSKRNFGLQSFLEHVE